MKKPKIGIDIFTQRRIYRKTRIICLYHDFVSGYKEEEILKKSTMIDTEKLKKYQNENCTEKLLDDTM